MKRFFALSLFFLFLACSSDNGTAPKDPGGGGGGGGTVTNEDTLNVIAMQGIVTQLEQWQGLDPDTIATRALNYINTLPSIASAGIADGTTTVWANFKNGFSFLIPNNREASTQADTLVDARSSSSLRSSSLSPPPARHITIPAGRRMMRVLDVPTVGRELPAVPRFRAVNAIGTCHINPLPGIRALLTAGHYTNANPGPPTVANLKNVHGDGIFYINSHGGPGFDANSVAYYAIWTLDAIDLATLPAYKTMVDSHELVGMLEYSDSPGGCAKVMHYGITSKFVRNHMSFAKNSLVVVDACSSASGPAQSMRDAFAAVGASVYVGWTRTVTAGFAYAAMKYMFDRILGLNVISPEDPEQRAFNIYDVKDDMANKGLTVEPGNGTELTVFPLGEDFGLLTPSIQFLSLEENGLRTLLIIAGIFGTDPGDGNRAVTINDQMADNIQWGPTEIACEIPTTGANSAGTVVVSIGTGQNERKSNPVNLTEWKGELVYDRDDPGSQQATMTMSVRFRADIHDFRDKPGEQPFKTTVLFTASDDSKIDITSGGVFTETIANCTDTYTLGNNGSAKSPFIPGTNASWIYFGSVDTQTHKLRLIMQVLAVWQAGTWKQEGDCENFSKPLYAQLAIEDCLFDDLNVTTAFGMPMTDEFEISAGQRGPCDVDPMVSMHTDEKGHAKIHWTGITPFSLPDPNTAR